MGRVKRKLWTGLLLFALLWTAGAPGEDAAPKETAAPLVPALELPVPENGSLVEIPVDQNSLKESIPPKEECYLYAEEGADPTGYADPSITVNIGRGRIYNTDYIYARVRIASPSQLRTLLASPLGNMNTTNGHDLARRVNAVTAINGDYPGGDAFTRRTKGAVMRQGDLMRLKCDGKSDVLVIDNQGDLRVLQQATDQDVEAVLDTAVNIFTFGPALIIDGKPNYDFPDGDIAAGKAAQRMVICQTGPLEYLLITTEGPEDPGSAGLTVNQLIDLLASLPEVRTAYNLDGGSSSTLVFRKDGKNWRKINAPNNRKVRELKDIIYFASAWGE